MRHFHLQSFDLDQVSILVMKNRRHSQNPRGDDGQAEDNDGAQAVAPGGFHRSEGQADLEKPQIGFVERNRLNYFKIPFAPAAVDDLTEQLTIDFGFQYQRLFFLLSNTTPVGVGNNIQIAIEKRDKLTVRLAAEVLDLALHADLFLEVKNIVGVGVNRDDPGKTARAHGDTERTAFPEFFILDTQRRLAGPFLGFFRGQAPALSPRVAYRRPVRLKGSVWRFFPGYNRRQRGKFPGPALLIEEIDLLQAVHRTDLCKQRLIDMTRHKQLVDQPGVIHQALPDQILQQRVADDRVLNTGLHGFGQRRPLVFGLAQKFML